MIRGVGLVILYLLLGISIGAFEWFVYQPFIKNMTDKLFPPEKIRHNLRLSNFAALVTGWLSAIGIIIMMIPFGYLGMIAKLDFIH